MIHIVHGDLFQSPAQTIVNPVNCAGVMGAGLALEFKKRYPIMFEKYKKICDQHLLRPGKLLLVKNAEKWILLFPTKDDWVSGSRIAYIEEGLMNFAEHYESKGITSIAFPKLGCGLGGIDWFTVLALMKKYLDQLPIDVYVYV